MIFGDFSIETSTSINSIGADMFMIGRTNADLSARVIIGSSISLFSGSGLRTTRSCS